MNDEPSLDSILSGASTSAPEPTTRIVDEPESIITELADGKPSAIEVEPGEDRDEPAGRVPIGKIKEAEREKVAKRYTEQVAEFHQTIDRMRVEQAERDRQWEQRLLQMQQPPTPTQNAPEIWDDPNAFVRSQAMEMVSPLQQQMQAMARQVAEIQFRDQPGIVKEAEEAFNRATVTGQIDPAIHRRINTSPNPYLAAVEWHSEQAFRAKVGNDPAAYEQRLRAEERAAVLAEIQQTGRLPDFAAPSAATPGVMPSNFADARNAGNRAVGAGDQGDPSISEILASKQRGSIFK